MLSSIKNNVDMSILSKAHHTSTLRIDSLLYFTFLATVASIIIPYGQYFSLPLPTLGFIANPKDFIKNFLSSVAHILYQNCQILCYRKIHVYRIVHISGNIMPVIVLTESYGSWFIFSFIVYILASWILEAMIKTVSVFWSKCSNSIFLFHY